MLAPRTFVVMPVLIVLLLAGCASVRGPMPARALSFTRKKPSHEATAGDAETDKPDLAGGEPAPALSKPIQLTAFAADGETGTFWTETQLPTPGAEPVLDAVNGLMRLPPIDQPRLSFSDTVAGHWHHIRSDHAQYYSAEGLTWLAAGLGAGALMANTAFDEHFLRDTYAENVVLAPSHEFYERLHQPKVLGDGRYTIPVFALAAFSDTLLDRWEFGHVPAEWGRRSLRTILVGAPPMLVLQVLTGGSRPGETSAGSNWKPLQDNNGVSGHSFMGAIPFMSAAKMTDNGWLKAGLYAASALPALSRVNDDQHYFSQAFLGWWLAYAAASAVNRTELSETHVHVLPLAQPDAFGAALQFDY